MHNRLWCWAAVAAFILAARPLAAVDTAPDLVVYLSHSYGANWQGQTGVSYTIEVQNRSTVPPSSPIVVTDILPAGLTATAIGGAGWNCTLSSLTCTRTDAPTRTIVVTVDISATAPRSVTNTAVVSGGGDVTPANNTASDLMVIVPDPALNPQEWCLNLAAVATYPYEGAVVAADVNVDGKLDLILGGKTLRFGNGDGTFAAPIQIRTTSEPVAVADFNGDGDPDLAFATATYDAQAHRYDGQVTLLLGHGDGTFTLGATYPTGVRAMGSPGSITAADFDRDGRMDAVIGGGWNQHYLGFYDPSFYTILFGDGHGSFRSGRNVSLGESGVAVRAESLNGDDKPDLVAWSRGYQNCDRPPTNPITCMAYGAVGLYPGNGDGTFGGGSIQTLGFVSDLFVGDFDRDGTTDFICTLSDWFIVNYAEKWALSLYGHGWVGDMSLHIPTGYHTDHPVAVKAVADLNGDGFQDLVATGTTSTTAGFEVLLGLGNFDFAMPVHYDVGTGSAGVTAADFNNDGKPDLAVVTTAGLTILLNRCGVCDLIITSTHNGNFTQGRTGTYVLTVTNGGPGQTSGTVTVTDTLPAGMAATAISGTGWSCDLATLTCTRSDTLAAGASYPSITLTVSVPLSMSGSVINRATVSGGGDIQASNNVGSDPTTVVAPPNVVPGLDPAALLLLASALAAIGAFAVRGSGSAAR